MSGRCWRAPAPAACRRIQGGVHAGALRCPTFEWEALLVVGLCWPHAGTRWRTRVLTGKLLPVCLRPAAVPAETAALRCPGVPIRHFTSAHVQAGFPPPPGRVHRLACSVCVRFIAYNFS